MSGIAIITNPHSKLNKRNPQTTKLLGYIVGEHGQVEISESLEALEKIALDFRNKDIEILAINGGDGTISRTLTAFIHAYQDKPLPKVALLRGGTMNVLAMNLGIRGQPPKVLYRLCEMYSRNQPLPTAALSTLEIDGNHGFLYADGAAVNMLREFYKNKSNALGAAWFIIKIAISALFNGKLFQKIVNAHPLYLTTNSQTFHHQSCGVFAASIERMPFGFKLFPKARAALKQLQFFSITCPPESVLWKSWLILGRRQEGSFPEKINYVAKNLEIKGPASYNYSLDGEIYVSANDTVKINPGKSIEFVLV